MKALLDLAVPSLTFLLLLGVGLDLTPAEFMRVRRQRTVLAAGLVGPLLVLPPLALLLVVLFRPSSDLQAGLLLVAACPIGGISNTYSYLARASTALSVTLTACSSLVAVVTIPALALVFGAALGRPVGYAVPLPFMLAQLLLMLAAPVGLGMWVQPTDASRAFAAFFQGAGVRRDRGADRVDRGERPRCFCEWPVRHGTSGSDVRGHIVSGGLVDWHRKCASPSDRFTLATEFATRNIAVATAIALTLAGRVEFAVFATTYFLTEIPLMLCAIVVYRRWQQVP